VSKNKAYIIGNQFIFLNCYDVLLGRFPVRLQPTAVEFETVYVGRANWRSTLAMRQTKATEAMGMGTTGACLRAPGPSARFKAAKYAPCSESAVCSVAENDDSVSYAL
jgi:hypothetical protein